MAMGFVQDRKTGQTVCSDGKNGERALLRFDDGKSGKKRSITASIANMNVFCQGATGTGKTSSCILPMTAECIRRGYPVVLVDIKGNLGPQVRALAKHYNREKDIVEFGNCAEAFSVNLLEGMDTNAVFDLAQGLISKKALSSQSNDWHYKGVRYLTDIFAVLSFLKEKDKRFAPTLEMLSSIVNNPQKAHRLMAYFMVKVADPKNDTHREFYQRILEDNFNLLRQPDEHNKDDYDSQTTWASQMIRLLLMEILSAPGIVEKFSVPDAPPVNFKELLYDQNKIVLLRFSPEASWAGAIISRMLLGKLYSTVRAHGLSFRKSQAGSVTPLYSSLIMDEYQAVANLDPSDKLNDTQFLAQSREFGHINILCSQSISGITTQYEPFSVDSLLSNCRTKLSFATDDPETVSCMGRFGLDITDLGLGEVAVISPDRKTGKVQKSVMGLQTEHDYTKQLVESASCDEFLPVTEEEREHIRKKLKQSLKALDELSAAPTENVKKVFEAAKKYSQCLNVNELKKIYYHVEKKADKDDGTPFRGKRPGYNKPRWAEFDKSHCVESRLLGSLMTESESDESESESRSVCPVDWHDVR